MSIRLVDGLGASPPGHLPLIETDALIIGAGPVGLYQAFQLGLLEIRAHLVDSLPYPGGQPSELYPDKPIYDLPAIPVCTGQELTQALLRQVRPFAPGMHLGQTVSELTRQPDGRLLALTSQGQAFLTKTLFIAAGVGAFEPKRLPAEVFRVFEGRQVFFRPEEITADIPARLAVVGAGEAAVGAALELADSGHTVTLIHRRDVFEAPAEMLARLQAMREAGRVTVVVGQPTDVSVTNGKLCAIGISAADNTVQTLPVDFMLVRLGISPRLGPLANWGLALERKHIPVQASDSATEEPGVYAIGDISTYPGKRKFIVCGFHESVMAAYAAAAFLRPDERLLLQYTTTSPRLHELLGVQTKT